MEHCIERALKLNMETNQFQFRLTPPYICWLWCACDKLISFSFFIWKIDFIIPSRHLSFKSNGRLYPVFCNNRPEIGQLDIMKQATSGINSWEQYQTSIFKNRKQLIKMFFQASPVTGASLRGNYILTSNLKAQQIICPNDRKTFKVTVTTCVPLLLNQHLWDASELAHAAYPLLSHRQPSKQPAEPASPPPRPCTWHSNCLGSSHRAEDFKAWPIQLCMSIPSCDTTVMEPQICIHDPKHFAPRFNFSEFQKPDSPLETWQAREEKGSVHVKYAVSMCFTNFLISDNQSQKHNQHLSLITSWVISLYIHTFSDLQKPNLKILCCVFVNAVFSRIWTLRDILEKFIRTLLYF